MSGSPLVPPPLPAYLPDVASPGLVTAFQEARQDAMDAGARAAALERAFLACRSGADLCWFLHLLAVHGVPPGAFERARRTRPDGLDGHPWLTREARDDALIAVIDALGGTEGTAGTDRIAAQLLSRAGDCGLLPYEGPACVHLRAVAQRLYAEGVTLEGAGRGADGRPLVLPPGGGPRLLRLVAGSQARNLDAARRRLVAVLVALPGIPPEALAVLVAHLGDWARGAEFGLVLHTVHAHPALFVQLCHGTREPADVVQACQGPWLPQDPAGHAALLALLERSDARRVGGRVALFRELFTRAPASADHVARAAEVFAAAARSAPEEALEWLERAPLYRLAQVDRTALTPLLAHASPTVRERAVLGLARLAKAATRKPPRAR